MQLKNECLFAFIVIETYACGVWEQGHVFINIIYNDSFLYCLKKNYGDDDTGRLWRYLHNDTRTHTHRGSVVRG